MSRRGRLTSLHGRDDDYRSLRDGSRFKSHDNAETKSKNNKSAGGSWKKRPARRRRSKSKASSDSDASGDDASASDDTASDSDTPTAKRATVRGNEDDVQ